MHGEEEEENELALVLPINEDFWYSMYPPIAPGSTLFPTYISVGFFVVKSDFILEPCAGLKVWPVTALPRSEEARTRTAPHNHSMRGARTAPQTSIFRPAPAPHRTMENVGPH